MFIITEGEKIRVAKVALNCHILRVEINTSCVSVLRDKQGFTFFNPIIST